MSLDRKKDQIALARRIARGDLSVRAVEKMVAQREGRNKRPRRIRRTISSEVREIVERLQRALGTAVKIVPRGKGGRLEIEYYSDDDLERLVDLIGGGGEDRDHTPGGD